MIKTTKINKEKDHYKMKAKEVIKVLDISRMTLHNYVKQGKIRIKEKDNGFYDYNSDDVYKLLNKERDRKDVIYARVSSTSQKKDLENQIETLRTFCFRNGIKIGEEYTDICSGMDFDRKQFRKMLDEITEYKIRTVYITYKDRLTRLSFNVFESLFAKYGTEIVVLDDIDNPKEIEKEIFGEIITLLHSFSMKMYSSRRKEKLSLMEKELKLENDINNIEE